MTTINSAAVLRQFDGLVKQGELFYTPTKPSFVTDNDFEFELRLSPSFAAKPSFTSTTTAQSSRRPPPTDGSDIDHSDPAFFVAEVHGTHKFILNKFCLFRPQFLLLTLDPKRRQTELLDVDDFGAVWAALGALDGVSGKAEEAGTGVGGCVEEEPERHYAIFNGGKEAGSSRKHKHLQILAQPRRSSGDLPLVGYNPSLLSNLGITAFFARLDSLAGLDVEQAGQQLAAIAKQHYAGCRDALGIREGEGALLPHNVMLTREWMVTVPRRRATLEGGRLEGHVVGCQGVLGSVWCGLEEQIEAWRREGCVRVVRELCVPTER